MYRIGGPASSLPHSFSEVEVSSLLLDRITGQTAPIQGPQLVCISDTIAHAAWQCEHVNPGPPLHNIKYF